MVGRRALNATIGVRVPAELPNAGHGYTFRQAAVLWRVNPPGRGRRLLTGWCRKAWESCSQPSATLRGYSSEAEPRSSKPSVAGSIPAARSKQQTYAAFV